ncbi:transforming growth factor-beta receptor-associated protein 1-like isoform X2 [Antedon mediterranea]|uniref:transforming growth factor-beta receptor-associated protein 1-like isoform X2 n=1 Tax=Antedon mediterranea TaxID=105859 RepID=UPI003AF93C97
MSVKAFELVPAIERLQLLGDKAKTSIECIECCGKNLYIGTSDCFVVHFLLEEKVQANGKISFTSEKQSHKYLAVRKPISQLKAASALTRILVLCDNVLTLLNMFNLEPILSGAKIKGVTSFTVNENPTGSNPFAIEICVATRKKSVQLYSITEDKMNMMKEVTIPDVPILMSMDRYCVCTAMATEYCLVDTDTLHVTDLFPYEHETSIPVVKRVGKEEFLLSGPGALGMFVTSAGMSQRPPLKWSESVCGVCYAFPYIVALDEEFLTVHSVLDQQPPLHDFADIRQIVRSDKARLNECKRFLIGMLEDIRGSSLAIDMKEDVDTTLLKLYAECDLIKLQKLVSTENACKLEDSFKILEKNDCHHALATLSRLHGDNESALQIWVKLSDGVLQDDSFPGFEFVFNFLSVLSEHDLLWRHIDWALRKNQEKAVMIFTERPATETSSERLRPDDVIAFLSSYPKAIIRYLEFLVFTKKLEKEKYHTHLAVLYLDAVLQLRKESQSEKTQQDLARSKLRHMLQTSNLYRVQLILGKVKETDMYAECAILYGKLEEHDKALRILVYKLQDYGAAENYCHVNSLGRDKTYRRRLFQILLGVYLDPLEGKQDSLIAPAITLLNSDIADFDNIRVLQIIPDSWSVGLVTKFLTHTLRHNMHSCRTTKVQRMLARGENLNLKSVLCAENKHPIFVGDDRVCKVCNQAFVDASFVRYPNGTITHVHCARNRSVCPVTGKLFSTKKS